ncbi:MAG: hypothetical protein HQL29_02485 [Candidatus Omnitrophica bacterium]|nr:hypothetical protein [Candidatus Omnitrophota bacterium]
MVSVRKQFAALILVLSIFGFFSSVVFAQEDVSAPIDYENFSSITSRTTIESDNVYGQGYQTSFYKDGFFYNQEMDVFGQTKTPDGVQTLTEMNFRSTDNSLVDIEHLSLQKFTYNVKDGKNDITIGDYFANFSQYGMNKSIKGIGYQRNFWDDKNYFRAAFGSFDGRWDYIFEDFVGQDLKTTEPMNRWGGGARYQMGGKDFIVGLNTVFVGDDGTDPKRTTEDAYLQYVQALDWEYRFKTFKFDGDHAVSYTIKKPVASDDTHKYGQAHKVNIRGNLAGVTLEGRAEIVDPDFSTMAGGATSDRVRLYGKAAKRFSKDWKAHASYNYYFDRINHRSTKTVRTTNDNFEAQIKHSNLLGRKKMDVSATYRLGNKWTEDDSRDILTNRIKLSLSDTVFKYFKYRINAEGIFEEDEVNKTLEGSYLGSVDISARKKFFDKVTVRPGFFYSIRKVDNITSRGDDLINTFRLNTNADYENNSAGFNFEFVDTNIFQSTDSFTSRWDVYYERKLKMIKDASVKLEYKVNMYKFSTDAPINNDYGEERLMMTFKMTV